MRSVLKTCSFITGLALLGICAEWFFVYYPKNIFLEVALGVSALGAFFLIVVPGMWIVDAIRLHAHIKEKKQHLLDIEGLNSFVEGLERERKLLRAEVERLKPEQELLNATRTHDSFDEFITSLASVVAKNLIGTREITIYRWKKDEPCIPFFHYKFDRVNELFIILTPEGGKIISENMQGEPLKSRKFGVRNVEIKEHNTETVVTGELGFTLPNRIRKTVGKVKLNLPKADLDLTTDIEQAKERLKSEILSVHMDNENVEEALTRPLPQRFDTARNILDISCKMGTESEIIGVIKVGFDTDGIDIKERIEIWEPLLASASNHVARALRGQGFQERAIKDGLTGLYNKSYMLDSLQAAFERSIESGEDLSLIMIDIDHFKGVNDTYGHMTGDIILKGVAQLMASAARATDIAFRYGGEEMGFILSGQNARKALTLANRVREKVEKAVFTGEKRETISVTISLGVAHHTKDMKSADELLSRADEALYYSKEHGRNQATAWKANNMGSSAK